MKKNIVMVLAILVFIGCSDKEPIPKEPAPQKVEIKVSSSNQTVQTQAVVEEFIPEHIRRSTIEVVERPSY